MDQGSRRAIRRIATWAGGMKSWSSRSMHNNSLMTGGRLYARSSSMPGRPALARICILSLHRGHKSGPGSRFYDGYKAVQQQPARSSTDAGRVLFVSGKAADGRDASTWTDMRSVFNCHARDTLSMGSSEQYMKLMYPTTHGLPAHCPILRVAALYLMGLSACRHGSSNRKERLPARYLPTTILTTTFRTVRAQLQ